MIGKGENAVPIQIDQAERLVEIEGNTDGIDGKPLGIALDFGFVVGNDDLPNMAFQLAARVDGFETEHLIEDNIVRAVRLTHEEVHGIGGHERFLEFDPVIALPCCHRLPPIRTANRHRHRPIR